MPPKYSIRPATANVIVPEVKTAQIMSRSQRAIRLRAQRAARAAKKPGEPAGPRPASGIARRRRPRPGRERAGGRSARRSSRDRRPRTAGAIRTESGTCGSARTCPRGCDDRPQELPARRGEPGQDVVGLGRRGRLVDDAPELGRAGESAEPVDRRVRVGHRGRLGSRHQHHLVGRRRQRRDARAQPRAGVDQQQVGLCLELRELRRPGVPGRRRAPRPASASRGPRGRSGFPPGPSRSPRPAGGRPPARLPGRTAAPGRRAGRCSPVRGRRPPAPPAGPASPSAIARFKRQVRRADAPLAAGQDQRPAPGSPGRRGSRRRLGRRPDISHCHPHARTGRRLDLGDGRSRSCLNQLSQSVGLVGHE